MMTRLPVDYEMVWIEGGDFLMGSTDFYPDEVPVRRVTVAGFWMDVFPVTNARFAEFVVDTGYCTEAEKPPDSDLYPGARSEDLVPGALVFEMSEGPVPLNNFRQWWSWTPGACWRHPLGPGSDLVGLSDHPVVQVSFADARAFCRWAGLDLPSEAEWEYAARGGLEGSTFAWGDDDRQESEPVANTWQGRFPFENTEVDGWTRTSPVGSYPPNGYGLYDLCGNVWEWTADWYSAAHLPTPSPCCGSSARRAENLDQLTEIGSKVVKGGSHLCTPQYCYRYRPAARQPQTVDTATSHLGFRCIRPVSS